MPFTYQTISKVEMPQHKAAIMEFFSNYRYIEDYSVAIDNSAFISVCWFEDVIVGAGRVVSDLSRFGLIVDLNVFEAQRNKGVGTQLVKNLVQACVNANIRHIELSTDPRYSWLEDFYAKVGFETIRDSAAMRWPSR